MMDDRLYDLVIEWDRRRQLREEVTPEVLCADEPELLERLREAIANVKATDWLYTDGEDADVGFLSMPDFRAVDGRSS